MLEDRLIITTFSDPNLTPVDAGETRKVGPRVFAARVMQKPEEKLPAYGFVGRVSGEEFLRHIRTEHHLSDNYGVVFISQEVLKGVDATSSRGILGTERDHYIVRGLLISPQLIWQARIMYNLSDSQGVVFASPEDFPGLNL